MNEQRNIEKKEILCEKLAGLVSCLLSVGWALWQLAKAEYIGELCFHHIINKNTGEMLGVVTSLVIYLFYWFVGVVWLGSITTAISGTIVLLPSLAYIHRKEHKRSWKEKYGKSYDIFLPLSLKGASVVAFILLTLYACGLYAT